MPLLTKVTLEVVSLSLKKETEEGHFCPDPQQALCLWTHISQRPFLAGTMFRTQEMCVHVPSMFPRLFSFPALLTGWWTVQAHRELETTSSCIWKASVYLKMQMWPTSKTDRQENTREQRERYPVWSSVPPSITPAEITRHQNHLNSSGSLSERPTFQTSRLVSPKSSPADHSSPDLKYWLSHFQKYPGTWRWWCPGQVLPGGGPLTLTPVS